MINPVEKLFGRFIPYRGAKAAEVDPEIFSHLQLHIAAHPDIETSCVLANLFRAIYMGSTLFYVESLEHLDATSRSLARDLVRARLSNAFLPEEWDEAHRLISQLPAERGGIAPREFSAAAATSAFAEKSATVSPAVGSLAWMQAWVEYFKWLVPRRAATAFAFASLRGGFDGFKYLWGAPAAAAVIGAFFGVVLLDEQLELRRTIISSPPVQWIAEIAGLELGGDEEPAVDDIGAPVPTKGRSPSLARPQPEAQPVGVEEPAATISHAKEVASGQEVALEGLVKPPAAVSEHLGTSQALEKPKTTPISRERPDQQFAPRPIRVLDPTTGGDSGGGGAQSVPEATSGKFPAEKGQNLDANSIPKIADDKPGSPKTNSVATAAKPRQEALKKVKPAVINAKR
ncbi:MAG: hypothetical protein ACREV2_06430, partial [Burkholderiales bacterium]